jgi:hypothetical protein
MQSAQNFKDLQSGTIIPINDISNFNNLSKNTETYAILPTRRDINDCGDIKLSLSAPFRIVGNRLSPFQPVSTRLDPFWLVP